MTELIGISGSLRAGSFNSALLKYAQSVVPQGSMMHVASIAEIPLYNADVEKAKGLPLVVAELKEQISAADGLLLVTPEYNNSIPGVLKNAIDWLTRPASDIPKIFGGRPVAIMGATPRHLGTSLSQTAWLPVIRALGMCPWFGRTVYVSHAASVFDSEGNITDEALATRVARFMEGYIEFIRNTG